MSFFKKNKKIYIFLSVSLLAVFGFKKFDQYFEISKNLEIFNSVFRELYAGYVEQVEPGKLIKTATDAALNSLDPYTVLYTENELEDFKFMYSGEYGGIGASFLIRDQKPVITEVFENSVAHKSGLQPGDIILEVNGISVAKKNPDEISSLLKGQPGTTVQIKYYSTLQDKELNKVLQRAEIKPKNIPFSSIIDEKEGIGYIKLLSFTDQCSRELKDALGQLKAKGMRSIILDLRGNPGGLLHEAVNIVNLFIEKGTEVVFTKGRYSSWDKSYITLYQPTDLTIPLCILVDETSASASEIVAGAIQDLDRGVVVGRRTFGKGLVQQTKDLVYNTKLKFTVAKYYIPSGRCVQALDYSNRDEEGRVEKIPDSLITAFKTKKGRIVYDGAGINPDVEVENIFEKGILKSLYDEWMIFDFAVNFRKKNQGKLQTASKVQLSEEDWKNFLDFLKEKKFVYKSESFINLENLIASMKEEKQWEQNQATLEALRSRLHEYQQKEILLKKDIIKYSIEREIVKQQFMESGLAEFNSSKDLEILKAVEVLSNKNRYQEILTKIEKPQRPFNMFKRF
ncbi:MAG: S41 family peptidase [Bacteroidia bacterium]|nr:S41 family peptidase [Bacteroidia bacterium]